MTTFKLSSTRDINGNTRLATETNGRRVSVQRVNVEPLRPSEWAFEAACTLNGLDASEHYFRPVKNNRRSTVFEIVAH